MRRFVYPPVDFKPVVHTSFTSDHEGVTIGTGLYEAWAIVPSRPFHRSVIDELRLALHEPLMLTLMRTNCAHVDSHFEIVNPYLSSLSVEALSKRFGEIPNGYEVNRLVFHVGDGREEELKH